MNIDIKAFREDFYKGLISGRLSPVKETVEEVQAQCHMEITTLMIPGMNDSDEEIQALAQWLSSLRKDIPLHLSRYFPNYKLDIHPTPVEKIKKARDIAIQYLDYVYTAMLLTSGNNTYCPNWWKVNCQKRGIWDTE